MMMVAAVVTRTAVVTSYNYKYCALAFLSADDWAVILTTNAHVRLHSDNKVAPKRKGCPQTATALQRDTDGDGSIPERVSTQSPVCGYARPSEDDDVYRRPS